MYAMPRRLRGIQSIVTPCFGQRLTSVYRGLPCQRPADVELRGKAPASILRQIEHFVHEAEQWRPLSRFARRDGAVRPDSVPADAEIEQVGVADDGVEGRPQLVAHHREELRLGGVRRLGFRACHALLLELLRLARRRVCGR